MGDRGQRVNTFATKNDWIPILSDFEALLKVKYVLCGMFPNLEPVMYATSREIPNFGEPIWGNAVAEPHYLIMMEETPVYSESVRLNTGETRYVRDHGNNPESIVFWPGGVMEAHRAVISGEISKLSKLEFTEVLFRSLSKLIKKQFLSLDGYRVGPEAASLRRKGYRLTLSIGSPSEFDLASPSSVSGK
jgi:hypothetical protein